MKNFETLHKYRETYVKVSSNVCDRIRLAVSKKLFGTFARIYLCVKDTLKKAETVDRKHHVKFCGKSVQH